MGRLVGLRGVGCGGERLRRWGARLRKRGILGNFVVGFTDADKGVAPQILLRYLCIFV